MGSNIQQCRQCRKLFHSFGAAYCAECVEETERDFEKVKQYLYDHPHANVVEISQDTGVSEKKVFGFLREGRLTVDERFGLLLCEECGQSISSGRFCAVCARRLESDLQSAYVPVSQKKKPERKGMGKMHIDYSDR